MKIFGWNISLSKKTPTKATELKTGNRRAGAIIKKQPKREVSYQIADIKQAKQMARNIDTPDRSRILSIYDYINLDGHLISQIRNAKYEVLSEPWLLYNDDKPNEAATKLIAKRWFNNIIEYIVEAELYGFSVVELDGIDAKEGSNGVVILLPREHIMIEKQRLLIDGTASGDYLDYAQFTEELEILEFYNSREDLGILLQCAYNVIRKFYAVSDWSRANEKVGMPILAVEANTNNDDELDRIETSAANFGTDGYVVTQAGDKITLLERKNENFHITFKDKMQKSDEEVSKIINGQTGTSDVKAFVGTAEVHERTMATFTQARLQFIVDEVNEKVLPYLVRKGFAIDGLNFNYPELIRAKQKKLNPTQPNSTEPKSQEPPVK